MVGCTPAVEDRFLSFVLGDFVLYAHSWQEGHST